MEVIRNKNIFTQKKNNQLTITKLKKMKKTNTNNSSTIIHLKKQIILISQKDFIKKKATSTEIIPIFNIKIYLVKRLKSQSNNLNYCPFFHKNQK